MSGQLGELVVSIAADVARFREDMGRISQIAEDKSKHMSNVFSGIGKGLIAGLSVSSLVALSKQSLEVSDNISKASQKIGIATETLSALRYAAQLADVDFESLTSGMGKFNKSIVEAVGGAEKQEQAFRLLGITQAELKKNSPDEVFSKVATGMAGMADGANKTALAMALFGKSGANMIPLLNGGAEGLKQAREEAERFGLILSTETGKQAEEFNDNLTRMTNGFQGIVKQVVANNLPMMLKLSTAMVDFAKDSESVKKASDDIAAGMKTVASVGAVAFGIFKVAGDNLASLAAAMTFAAEGEFKKAWDALGSGGADTVADIQKTTDMIKKIWDETAESKDKATGKSGKGGKGDDPFLGEAEKNAQLLAAVTDKRLAYLKASAATETEMVKASTQVQLEMNRQAYDGGLQDLQSYLDTKRRFIEKEIEDEIALKKSEVDRYSTEAAKSAGKDDAKTRAEYFESLTKEQAAKKDLVALEGKLKISRLQSAEESKKLVADQLAGYAATHAAMMELAGDFEDAERVKQEEYRKTGDFLKLQVDALTGNAAAWQAMMDLEKEESIAMIDAQGKKNQLVRQYADDVAQLQDELDKWLGKDTQIITVERQMRDALSEQKDLQMKLTSAQAAGRTADIAYYSQKLQMQDILNQRLKQEIELLDRKRVLSGEVVGFSQEFQKDQAGNDVRDAKGNVIQIDVPIYRDAYDKAMRSTGYLSDAQLLNNTTNNRSSQMNVTNNITVQGGANANATGQTLAAEMSKSINNYPFQMINNPMWGF